MAKSVNMKVDFKKAKENQKILTGLVTGCDVVKVSETEVKYLLEVNCLGSKVLIEGDEIVNHPTKVTPKSLIGENIDFVVTEITDEAIFGSMQKANDILSSPIMQKLLNGEVLEGIVTYITPYGAYVNIQGTVSGILKNYDFANDGTEVREVYPKFSKIKVKLKKINSNGNIVFLPEEKRESKSFYDVSKINIRDAFLGKVTDIPLNMDYVRVIIDAKNLKVKCEYPTKIPDIRVGDRVVVTITKKIYLEDKDRYVLFGKITTRTDEFRNDGRRY